MLVQNHTTQDTDTCPCRDQSDGALTDGVHRDPYRWADQHCCEGVWCHPWGDAFRWLLKSPTCLALIRWELAACSVPGKWHWCCMFYHLWGLFFNYLPVMIFYREQRSVCFIPLNCGTTFYMERNQMLIFINIIILFTLFLCVWRQVQNKITANLDFRERLKEMSHNRFFFFFLLLYLSPAEDERPAIMVSACICLFVWMSVS